MKSSITIALLAALAFTGCNSENSAASVSETAGSVVRHNLGNAPQQPVEAPPRSGSTISESIIDELIAAIEHADELPQEEIATSVADSGRVDAIDLTDEDDWVEPEVGSWSAEISDAGDPVPEPCESILERLEI